MVIKSRFNKIAAAFVTMLIMVAVLAVPCLADDMYTNPDTGYEVIIQDDAYLLSGSEMDSLAELMENITEYGNVAFVSSNDYCYSSYDQAEEYYRAFFGKESGTLFFIDMYNRNIWIFSDGAIYKTVTKAYANVITDNTYRYASKADYYSCAYKSFEQIETLLEGRRISQPMKYIGNALLALILSLIVIYCIVRGLAKSKAASQRDVLTNIYVDCRFLNPQVAFKHSTRTYSPKSSSSSGGGGGGGGGGGHSGGGGGHSF